MRYRMCLQHLQVKMIVYHLLQVIDILAVTMGIDEIFTEVLQCTGDIIIMKVMINFQVKEGSTNNEEIVLMIKIQITTVKACTI